MLRTQFSNTKHQHSKLTLNNNIKKSISIYITFIKDKINIYNLKNQYQIVCRAEHFRQLIFELNILKMTAFKGHKQGG